MKTLIINGSPRKNGVTAAFIKLLRDRLPGETEVVDTYRAHVSPCIDCRHCWRESGCAIQDDMQEIYRKIDEADHIVLASPIYFAELTGSLLSWASRLQYIYASKRFRNEYVLQSKARRGALILVDGGDGVYEAAEAMGRRLLRTMGAPCKCFLYYTGTDQSEREDPSQDLVAMRQLDTLVQALSDRME